MRKTIAALAVLLATPAVAQVPAPAAALVATQACPAGVSIRRPGGADAATLEPGRRYRVLGQNKAEATFYQVEVDGRRLWAPVTCFDAAGAAAVPSPAQAGRAAAASYVLAVSWQPSFCRGHAAAAECAGGGNAGLGLHGLWPQPIGKAYCGVDRALADADIHHQWDRLPEPDLSAQTRARLGRVMPGLRSGLERHEWIKHGTCSGVSADSYFGRAADLAEQVIGTSLSGFLQNQAGGTLTVEGLRGAVDAALGAGTGARVTLSCGGQGAGRDVSELVIGLAGDVVGSGPITPLILAAPPAKPGCPAGRVD